MKHHSCADGRYASRSRWVWRWGASVLGWLCLQTEGATFATYTINSDSQLNNLLSTASTSGTNLKLIFPPPTTAYKLTSSYSVSNGLMLDASGVPGGVRLIAARRQSHFTVSRSPPNVGNLTALNIIFEDGYQAGASLAGSMQVLGNLTTWNCTFINNTRADVLGTGDAGGGAISLQSLGNAFLYNTSFISNTVTSTKGFAGGGAIYSPHSPYGKGKLRLSGCVFRNNSVTNQRIGVSGGLRFGGGAVWYRTGSIEITATRFIGNSVRALARGTTTFLQVVGGGLMIRGTSSCKISSTRFESNQLYMNSTGSNYSSSTRPGLYGGGLYIADASCDLSSVTFTTNGMKSYYSGTGGYADASGGAAYFISGLATRIRLTGCQFSRNTVAVTRGDGYGGAIAASNMTLQIRGSLFTANSVNTSVVGPAIEGSAQGGAVYYRGAKLEVHSTTFTNNLITCWAYDFKYALAEGGAVYAYGYLPFGVSSVLYSFQSSRFSGNRISATAVVGNNAGACAILTQGGGLRVYSAAKGAVNVTACSFTKNSVYLNGRWPSNQYALGGALASSGTPKWSTRIRDSAFQLNSANSTVRSYGGAVHAKENITISNSTFLNNMVALLTPVLYGRARGSAVFAESSDTTDFMTVALDSCTLTGNTAFQTAGSEVDAAGAVFTDDVDKLRVKSCVFNRNTAYKGLSPGAVYAYNSVAVASTATTAITIEGSTFLNSGTYGVGLMGKGSFTCVDTEFSAMALTYPSWASSNGNPACYWSPTRAPTVIPTTSPTRLPTRVPTRLPTTMAPTVVPTIAPTMAPTTPPPVWTSVPTITPTIVPTIAPSPSPPTQAPITATSPSGLPLPPVDLTILPTPSPTSAPTRVPTRVPTRIPSVVPTPRPTLPPSLAPTPPPTTLPTVPPTTPPTRLPTTLPTVTPTTLPSLLPTAPPSVRPTVLPSARPTLSSTLSPTAPITYTITIRSPSHLRAGGMGINKEDVSLQVSPSIARSDGAAVWRSANASLLRPLVEGGGLLSQSLSTSFLGLSGGALVEGRAYVISVSATGSLIDAQVTLVVNAGPKGGSLVVSPMSGQALLTTFTATCAGWTDVDLPLSYRYTAELPGLPQATRLMLAGPTNRTTVQTSLPPSANLTFRVSVMDALGASTLATRTSISVTRLANTSKALSVLSTLELQVNSSGSSLLPVKLDNSTATRLVSTLGLVTKALTAMPEPVTPALETRILNLMNASLGAVSLDLSRAEALGGVLQALSSQETAEAPAHDILDLTTTFTQQVQEQVGSISTSLTTSILDAIDGVIRFRHALTPVTETAGTQTNRSVVVNITSPSACALVEQSSRRMDSILDNVHNLVASKLSPGQAASQHTTPSLALASQSETLETLGAGQGLQLGPSLDLGLRFSLNATALQSTSFRSLSANQTITIKKVDWANNRRPCAEMSGLLSEASGWEGPSGAVQATSVGQIDVVLPQSQDTLKLAALAPPLQLSTAQPAFVSQSVSCGRGKRGSKQVTCPGPGKTLVTVECDGQADTVTALCPAPMPVCVFWNHTDKAWSKKGVTTKGIENGRLICESTHASEFAVLQFTGEQLWMLSEMLRNPDWLETDRSVIVAVGVMYCLFLIAILGGQKKKRVDDRYFVDGVKARQFYGDAATCLSSLREGQLPDKRLGSGDHFYHKRNLTRRLDSVVAELTGRRIAVLQMGQAPAFKKGQVSSEVLSFSLSAQMGPTWQQRRLWIFLRGLTIFFLCTLLHGSEKSGFISAVMSEGKVTYEMIMDQLSVAFQRAFVAFPLSLMVENLTRVINRKAREDRKIEEESDFPFFLPSTEETLDRETYFCALRMAIKQLDLTKRVLTHDMRVKGERDQQLDPRFLEVVVNANKAVIELQKRYRNELAASYRNSGGCGYALSCVIGCLPIEVTGQLSVVNGLDVEKTIETEYDRWVTEHLRDQGCLGPLLAWYYRSWIAPSDMDGSKSSGIPWGYLLSYGCLVLYTLVLTLSTTLLSLSYTSRDAITVFFACIFTLGTNMVTMSALSFLMRILGIALSRRLADHVSTFQRPFLEHVTNQRDAVTGLRMSGVAGGRTADQGQKLKLNFDRPQVAVQSRGKRRGDVDDIGLDVHDIGVPAYGEPIKSDGLLRFGPALGPSDDAYTPPPDLPDEEDEVYDEPTSEKATRHSRHGSRLKVMSEEATELYEVEGVRRHKKGERKVHPASEDGYSPGREERRRSRMAGSQDMGAEGQDEPPSARSPSRAHRKSKQRGGRRRSQGEEAGEAEYNDEDAGPYEDEAGRDQQNDIEVDEMDGEYAGDEPAEGYQEAYQEAYQEDYQEGEGREDGMKRKGKGRRRSTKSTGAAEPRRSSKAHR